MSTRRKPTTAEITVAEARQADLIAPTLKPEPGPGTAHRYLKTAGETLEDRGELYDVPGGEERSIPSVMVAFNAITGRGLTDREGWLLLLLLKSRRLLIAPHHHDDSCVDLVAYAALLAESSALGDAIPPA